MDRQNKKTRTDQKEIDMENDENEELEYEDPYEDEYADEDDEEIVEDVDEEGVDLEQFKRLQMVISLL
jgi:hypothetical protein